jgi:DNA topoisomerase-1
MLAAEALRQTGPAKTKREADRNIIAAVDLTAKRLGNTRSVCRKYYIHPALIEAYLEGSVLPPLPERRWSARKPGGPALRQHEKDVLNFLKARLKPEKRRSAASRYKKSSAANPPQSVGVQPEPAEPMVAPSVETNETDRRDT